MAGFFLYQIVEETTTTEGTGTLNLDGATSGHKKFADTFGNGVSCSYTILDGLGAWEYGVGTIVDASPDTLARDLVIGSSAGGAKLSLGPGSKLVYCEAPPEQANNGVAAFTDGDVTPSVKGGHVFVSSPTASTQITNFDDGIAGQEIIIICTNGNTVFKQGGTIKNPAALDLTSTANDVFTYVSTGSAWCLVFASVNG